MLVNWTFLLGCPVLLIRCLGRSALHSIRVLALWTLYCSRRRGFHHSPQLLSTLHTYPRNRWQAHLSHDTQTLLEPVCWSHLTFWGQLYFKHLALQKVPRQSCLPQSRGWLGFFHTCRMVACFRSQVCYTAEWSAVWILWLFLVLVGC